MNETTEQTDRETVIRAMALASATDDVRNRHAYGLARDAECSSPDTPESAGAGFLTGVRDGVLEVIDYYANNDDTWHDAAMNHDESSIDDDGALHEIADGAPSVYTHEVWEQFVDLGAYNEDPTDLGEDGSDMQRCASVCLYIIADRLARVLVDEIADAYRDAYDDLNDDGTET